MNLKPFLFLFLLACLIAPAAAAGGSGTATNPYIIETAAELQSIQNNLAAYYELGNDIDLSGVTWTPIGSASAPFVGTLDGNGYTISNLLYSSNSITSLFAYIGTNGHIYDIKLSSFNLEGDGHTAALVGRIQSSTNVIIDNVDIYNSYLKASSETAGIVGATPSSFLVISNCDVYNSIIHSTTRHSAGILGYIYYNSGVEIINCNVINTICTVDKVRAAGIVSGTYTYSSDICDIRITACNVIDSTICASSEVASGCCIVDSSNTNTHISNVNVRNSNIIVQSDGSCSGIINSGINGIVSDCSVSNTNLYGSSIYNIGPNGSYDSTSTAIEITNVPNRYLYASGISYTLAGSTATLTLDNRQGAAVVETATGAAATDIWDYGDGTTGEADTHTYAAGIYSADITISSYLATTPQTFYSTPINIGIPTYTANSVTTQDADIVIDAGQLYQAQTQYVLPSTTSDLEFFADNLFVVASGNAVYTVDTATQEITPVSTTTGTTADKIYLGENSAVITDINGNTAVYQYEENSFDYLASGNSQQIAATGNYAGVLINGKLNIYDLTEPRKIGDVTASVSQLAANDYADTFAGITGTTLNYWWIDNGEIKSGSQTLTNTITAIKQIPQTQNYILTTTKNTVIVGISATGTYSLISTSDTELPLIHPQATTIGVVIGVHAPNEIYIVGADGSTAGTYQTGATLNDASITKATGLFAITGGNDQQAYVLRKDQSSTWTLAQTVTANGVLSHTQISTTGNYAAIVSGVNMYLLKRSSTTDANNYYLQGVIIESNGKLYSGSFTINGEKVTTDTTGKFIYQVTPGNLYKITVQGTTTEYTASNAALQQIAIRIKAGLLSTEVTYNAEYSAEAQAIVMSYDDSAGKTTVVNWNVYETANNTLVATYTGNSASFPVAPGDVYNNYYVQLSADRGAATVANTWSITPAGGQPVDLYGLDEDGRNIIFGFLLLLLAGLFGVMHSRSGAIIVALGACVMRYLELITIPWILITIAAVLAIVAAIAHGGQNR